MQIHHDRITFSLHEPTRGQTFKSVLKRDLVILEPTTERLRVHRSKKIIREEEPAQRKKFHIKIKSRPAEGKGVIKERNDSEYANRRMVKNNIKLREDTSEDISD